MSFGVISSLSELISPASPCLGAFAAGGWGYWSHPGEETLLFISDLRLSIHPQQGLVLGYIKQTRSMWLRNAYTSVLTESFWQSVHFTLPPEATSGEKIPRLWVSQPALVSLPSHRCHHRTWALVLVTPVVPVISLACLGEPLGPESQPGAMLHHTCLLASLVASLLGYRWKEPDGWLHISSKGPFYLDLLGLNGIGPLCSADALTEPVSLVRSQVWPRVTEDRAGVGSGFTQGSGPWEWPLAEQCSVRVPGVREPMIFCSPWWGKCNFILSPLTY